MKLMIVDGRCGRATIAVDESEIFMIANIFDESKDVDSFYIEGMNVTNQPQVFGFGNFKKWISPISH